MSISTCQSISHLFLCNHVTICKILKVEMVGFLYHIYRGDVVVHGLAGKKFRGAASEDAVGRVHQRHLREAAPREISQPFPSSMGMKLCLAC